MKKILSILLVMVMIFSLSVFATETTDEQTENVETITESVESAEEIVEEDEQIYFKAKVVEASEVGEKEYMMDYYGQEIAYPVTGQDLKLIVQEGKHKGAELNLVYPLGEQGATEYDDPAKVGDKIYITVEENVAQDGTKTFTGQIVLPINSTREIVVIVSIIALLVLVVLLTRLKSIRIIGVIILDLLILFITFGVFYLSNTPALVTLASTVISIIVANTLILNNCSKKSLVAILGIIVATILTTVLCISIINLTDVAKAFEIGTYQEGEFAKPEYIDIIIGTIIVASVGISINMGIRTVNEYVKGSGTLETIKNVSADLMKCLNGVLLLILGTLLTNVFYIAFENYPMHMIFFGDDNVFMEIIKIIVVLINPIIVIPITALLGKLILQPTKRIEEAK